MAIMINICNSLEKLSPPPFVTVKSNKSKAILSKWTKFISQSNYLSSSDLLLIEIRFLNGYILRKGSQLRLEKALLLSVQISKIANRWKLNDFSSAFNKFKDVIESVSSIKSFPLFPSSQWAHWIMYLILRDAALLASINKQCQEASKYWLGLISSEHHWSDSLVALGIIARIWNLSGIILEELIELIYPTIKALSQILKPTLSGNWPNNSWIPPENLKNWLNYAMKLPFERPSMNRSLDLFNKKFNININSSSSFSFSSSIIKKVEESKFDESFFYVDTTGSPKSQNNFEKVSDDTEDLGEIVNIKPAKSNRKSNQELIVSKPKNSSKFWKLFFKKCEKINKSGLKSKKLLNLIKLYKTKEEVLENRKLKIHLIKLLKATRAVLRDKSMSSESKLKEHSKNVDKFKRIVNKNVK